MPPIKDVDPDASSELELGADDILESEDIGAELDVDVFEQAAAGIAGFDEVAPHGATLRGEEGPAVAAPVAVILSAPAPAPRPSFLVPPAPAPPSPKAPPPPSPRAFVAAPPVVLMPPPVVVPPPFAVAAAAPEPVVPALVVPEPVVSTLMGIPPAPITSPLPLEESVIVNDQDQSEDEEGILRTQEMRGQQLAKVAEAAAFLDGDIQASTQILARSDMPTQLRQPAPQAVPTAAAWANGRHPPSAPMRSRPVSLAPIAVDLPRRAPSHAAIAADPRPAKKETSPLLIGGLCFAAAALVGIVGVGGYVASRTMTEKPSIAIAPAPQAEEPSSTNTTTAATAAADPAAAPADPAAGAAPVVAAGSAGVDVSSLPAAPVGGVALPPAPVQHAAAAPVANPAPPAPTTHVSSAPPPPATGRAGAPLPPPGAAAPPPTPVAQTAALPPPPSKAAPAAAAAPPVQATTGNVSVDPKLRAILVDGNYRHVSDNGTVTLSCGPHRIKVGMNDQQSVNVPCGGSISL